MKKIETNDELKTKAGVHMIFGGLLTVIPYALFERLVKLMDLVHSPIFWFGLIIVFILGVFGVGLFTYGVIENHEAFQ